MKTTAEVEQENAALRTALARLVAAVDIGVDNQPWNHWHALKDARQLVGPEAAAIFQQQTEEVAA